MSLTQSIALDKLQKKFLFDKTGTDVDREYFEESYSSRKEVLYSDIWLQSDEILSTAATVSGVVNLVTATLSWMDGTKGSYVNTSLKDAIPYYYGDGSSYRYKIFRNDGITPINQGECNWIFDGNSGVLSFTGVTNSGTGLVFNEESVIIASASAAPIMQVWKYVGKKGVLPNIGSGLTYSGGTLSVIADGGGENLSQTLAIGNSMGTYSIVMNTGKLFSTGSTSSFAISDSSTTISTPQLKLQKPGFVFSGDYYQLIEEASTSGAAQFKIYEILNSAIGPDAVVSIEVTIHAIDALNSLYHSNRMFAFFFVSSGTVAQIGTTDTNVKGNLSTGYSDIDTDGANIRVWVEGDSVSNLNWSAKINFQIST
jgi:hypothetical protein